MAAAFQNQYQTCQVTSSHVFKVLRRLHGITPDPQCTATTTRSIVCQDRIVCQDPGGSTEIHGGTISRKGPQSPGTKSLLDVQPYRKTTVESASFAEIHGGTISRKGPQSPTTKSLLDVQPYRNVSAERRRSISTACSLYQQGLDGGGMGIVCQDPG